MYVIEDGKYKAKDNVHASESHIENNLYRVYF